MKTPPWFCISVLASSPMPMQLHDLTPRNQDLWPNNFPKKTTWGLKPLATIMMVSCPRLAHLPPYTIYTNKLAHDTNAIHRLTRSLWVAGSDLMTPSSWLAIFPNKASCYSPRQATPINHYQPVTNSEVRYENGKQFAKPS